MSNEDEIPQATKDRLTTTWRGIAEELPASAEQIQFMGFNLRLDLSKAFIAVGATATAIASIEGAAALDPISLLKVPASVVAAVSAGIAAVYEKMHPLHYVACIVLAGHPNGLTKDEFEKNLRKFLDDSRNKNLPWYLGLTKTRLTDASAALGEPGKGGMDDLIKGLGQKKYVEETAGRFFHSVRSFKLGLVPD